MPGGDATGQLIVGSLRIRFVVEQCRPVTEHPPSGHRELEKRGRVGCAGKPQRSADDRDRMPGAGARFARNVHLSPEQKLRSGDANYPLANKDNCPCANHTPIRNPADQGFSASSHHCIDTR
jgi:hypothetical protein